MIVLKVERAARMQRWKDEKREANERMLVYDILFCLDQEIYVALSAT